MTELITCPDCYGTGIVWSEIVMDDDCCKRCDGEGRIVVGQPEERPIGNEKLTREELNRDQAKQ